jgi:hypothetical protein
MTDADIIAAAARIIRQTDDDGLIAMIRSTNPNGSLWGAIPMAREELARRNARAAA